MKNSLTDTLILLLKYLLLVALLVLIGDGVYEDWKHASPFKWIVTLATTGFIAVMVLLLLYSKISLESKIWLSLFFILIILLAQTVLYGTSFESGYTLFGIPAHLMVNILFASIIVIFLSACFTALE